MSDGFSERWDSQAESPTASPSVRTVRRNVRRLLRALGQPGGMSDGFSERWDSPAECPTALGQPGGMSDGFSERSDSPAECPTVSPSVRTARRNVRRPEILPYNPFDPRPETLFFGGQSFILFNHHLHMIGMLQRRITFPIERSTVRNHTTEVGSRIEITRIRRNAAIGLAQKQFVRMVATDGQA